MRTASFKKLSILDTINVVKHDKTSELHHQTAYLASTLKNRRAFIGASEAASALGLSKYESPYELVQKKKHGASTQIESLPMKVGKASEEIVLRLWKEANNTKAKMKFTGNKQLSFTHKLFNTIAATPDSIIDCGDYIKIVEAKTVNQFAFAQWNETIPQNYYLQAQMQMECVSSYFNYDVPICCEFAVLVNNTEYKQYTLRYDPVEGARIVTTINKFYEDCVIGDERPAMNLQDYSRVVPVANSIVKLDNADTNVAISAIADLRKLELDAEQIVESIEQKKKIIARMIDNNETLIDARGNTIATYKMQERKSFDSKAFQASNSELYNQFVKVLSSRTLRIK